MTPYDLFTHIQDVEYTESGDKVNWRVEVNNEEKTVYLLFQQSHGSRDWANNLNFIQKSYRKFTVGPLYKLQTSFMLIHRGFGDSYKTANDEIMHVLTQTASVYSDYKVVICGWSLGAGLAILACEDFNYRTRTITDDPNTGKKATLISFGSPMIIFGFITRHYLRKCCESATEYCQWNDVVSWLPPFLGFMHLKCVRLGEAFKIKKLFNPLEYHTHYGNKELYTK